MNIELRNLINKRAPEFLPPGREGGYVCPSCGSGMGRNGAGNIGLKLDEETGYWHCPSCDLEQDIVGLYAFSEGIDPEEAVEALGVFFGLSGSQTSEVHIEEPVTYQQTAKEEAAAANSNQSESYRETYCVTSYLQPFMDGSICRNVISTGFAKLDELLDGGLHAGLYCVSGKSAAGKTALLQQIGDQIADQGRDVLFVSFEQSRNELIARGISRNTARTIDNGFENMTMKNARSMHEILDSDKREAAGTEERMLISWAATVYSGYGEHVFIIEGDHKTDISKSMAKHVKERENAPVLIIDHKEMTAEDLRELKLLSRDYEIPVLVSINTSEETDQATAFAGADLCDVVLGLQDSLSSDIHKTVIRILKNRNGKAQRQTDYEYYAAVNYFKET